MVQSLIKHSIQEFQDVLQATHISKAAKHQLPLREDHVSAAWQTAHTQRCVTMRLIAKLANTKRICVHATQTVMYSGNKSLDQHHCPIFSNQTTIGHEYSITDAMTSCKNLKKHQPNDKKIKPKKTLKFTEIYANLRIFWNVGGWFCSTPYLHKGLMLGPPLSGWGWPQGWMHT